MPDSTVLKGFRTACAYFVENVYGTPLLSNTQCRKVAGKVRGVNWTARQSIIQTGNVGDGRNFKQQLLGNFDASASMNWEVGDFSFLRFGVGDIVKFDTGDAEAKPYFLVESELTGTDAATGLATTNALDAMTKIRIRPFSMLLYDVEQASSGTALVDTVDIMKGCTINDFSLSASIGTPLTCSTNIIVKEISHKRFIDQTTEMPNWTATTTSTNDPGIPVASELTPVTSLSYADESPLMFHNGIINVDGNVLAQVTSFNYNYNNQLVVFRIAGSRYIEMPSTGMRRQTLSANVIFRIESTTNLAQGIPTSSVTNILEFIKNYLGYASTTAVATTTELRPALALTTGGFGSNVAGGPITNIPIEKGYISLTFNSVGCSFVAGKTSKGAKITVRMMAIEGFGTPIQLENGLVEIPITFSVRGYPYKRVSDGSYNGYDGAGGTYSTFFPDTGGATFSWWYTT